MSGGLERGGGGPGGVNVEVGGGGGKQPLSGA